MINLSSFYQSKQWVSLMQVIKSERLNENGEIICEHCGKPIVRKYDCIGHHRIHLTENNVNNAEISLNPDNIMLVHHVCHNRIHNKLGHVQKQVYLVWGSPLSGKSTYVKESAGFGDLIVDTDNIWQCVSGCERYIKPDRLKSNVFGIRDTLIDMVKYRRGNWNNAYITGGYPLSGERERLIASVGAREIFIECAYDECIARLKAVRDGRNFSEWKKFIDDWWRKSGKSPPRQL
ncbi:MAG: HNH endonuclease [Ruminococcus sp.]|nr:HNH endonuclease [Ruminococcus sp.]